VRRWIVVLLLATSIASCRPGRGTLSDLGDVEELKDRFNRDAGAIRVVLLLSPT
jgi:hypothetical protein